MESITNLELNAGPQKTATQDLTAAADGDYVYWKTARAFALISLESFRQMAKWNGARLSKLPVIVYDSRGRPKYYEFQVLVNGNEAGVISCTAQKRDGGPDACVFPLKPDYTQPGTGGYKLIASGYPYVLYGRLSAPGVKPTDVMDARGSNTQAEDDPLDIALEHPEAFVFSNVTAVMVSNAAITTIKSNLLLWSNIQDHIADTINLSDGYDSLEELHTRWITQKGIQKSAQFNYGYAISGFDFNNLNSWWNYEWVWSQACMNWIISPTFSPRQRWCQLTAVGIVLAYYGYTINAMCYYYLYTNYINFPSNCTNIDIPSATNHFFSSFSGPGPVITYYLTLNDADNFEIAYAVPTVIVKSVISSGLTRVSPGHWKLDFNFSGSYSYDNIFLNIGVRFLSLAKKYCDLTISYGTWTQTIAIGYTTQTFLHDGYLLLGVNMGYPANGIWPSSTAFWNIVNGMRWASDNRLDYNWKWYGLIGDGAGDISGDWDILKQSIDNNDPFFLAADVTNMYDGHEQVGIGYATIPISVTYSFLGWYTWTNTEYWKYLLVVDGNGFENLDNVDNQRLYNPSLSERIYIWRNLFWERPVMTKCKFGSLVWHKY